MSVIPFYYATSTATRRIEAQSGLSGDIQETVMSTVTTAALFPLGRLVATPGALRLLAETGTTVADLLRRHQSGDWGDVPPEDARENA